MFHVLQAGGPGRAAADPRQGPDRPGLRRPHLLGHRDLRAAGAHLHPPARAADALRWRQLTLPTPRSGPRELGLEGAAFPWRTIRGRECSGYWPAGTAAFHINADIADAVVALPRRHRGRGSSSASGASSCWSRRPGCGAASATTTLDGRFRIDGVTGPDEYSAVADNNVYTNLMAQQNLRAAADVARPPPRPAPTAGRDDRGDGVVARRRRRHGRSPTTSDLGVHPQSEGFTDHARWDFEATRPDEYPLLLHFPYFDLYRKQVVKQADLVLAMHLRGDAFTAEEKARNFAYYEALTVRDSSLSACTQAVVAAEVGHLDLAYDYLGEAALVDLHDLATNTRDGLHMASLAGAWMALVAGFGGMRARDGRLRFAPRLPSGISRLAFRIRYRGSGCPVTTAATAATYELLDGSAITIAPPRRGREAGLEGRPQGHPARPPPAPADAAQGPRAAAPGAADRHPGPRGLAGPAGRPAARSDDLQHPLQRDPGPLGRVGVDRDAVDHPALDELLEHPRQVGEVDAVHRRARADQRVERHDGLVGVLLGEPVDEVDLGADARSSTRRGAARGLDDEVGRADLVGEPPRSRGAPRGARRRCRRGARPGRRRRARAGTAGGSSSGPATAGTWPPCSRPR